MTTEVAESLVVASLAALTLVGVSTEVVAVVAVAAAAEVVETAVVLSRGSEQSSNDRISRSRSSGSRKW